MIWLMDPNTPSELTKPSRHEGLLDWLEANAAEAAVALAEFFPQLTMRP